MAYRKIRLYSKHCILSKFVVLKRGLAKWIEQNKLYNSNCQPAKTELTT